MKTLRFAQAGMVFDEVLPACLKSEPMYKESLKKALLFI